MGVLKGTISDKCRASNVDRSNLVAGAGGGEGGGGGMENTDILLRHSCYYFLLLAPFLFFDAGRVVFCFFRVVIEVPTALGLLAQRLSIITCRCTRVFAAGLCTGFRPYCIFFIIYRYHGSFACFVFVRSSRRSVG